MSGSVHESIRDEDSHNSHRASNLLALPAQGKRIHLGENMRITEIVVLPSRALLRFICAATLICGAIISHAQTYATSISSSSGQSLPTTNATNPFSGSVPEKIRACSYRCTMR